MPRKRRITERAFACYLDCRYKAFLQLRGCKGEATAYEQHGAERARTYQATATARLERLCTQREVLRRVKLTPSAASSSRRLVLADRIVVDGLSTGPTVLLRGRTRPFSLEPVHFHRYGRVTSREKLLLGHKASLLGRLTGTSPRRGRVIHGDSFEMTSMLLSAYTKRAESIISQLVEMSASTQEKLLLNSNCSVCEFKEMCKAKAEAEDNMSLLGGMRPGHIEKQNKKGIFTVHQLSYTFRPRRPPKRAKRPGTPRHFALHAQAIRENRLYIHGPFELPRREHNLYFDVEGVPDRNSYYLIGVLVDDAIQLRHHAFWADDDAAVPAMLAGFSSLVATFPDAALFHQGIYDTTALRELKTRAAPGDQALLDRAVSACHNVAPVLYAHAYFPLYSTRLRDLARFLGCQLDSCVRDGAESIVYREQWEASQDDGLRNALIGYNREDCLALKTVCDFMRAGVSLASKHRTIPGRSEEVWLSDSLRRAGEGNRPKFKKAEFVLPAFDFANRCAYFDYQRAHVYARTGRKPTRTARRTAVRGTKKATSHTTDLVIRCEECPECGSARLRVLKKIHRQLTDLRFFKTGIGVKRLKANYTIWQYECRRCGETVVAPRAALNARSRSKYGYGLACWCVYQHIVGKQPMRQVERSLQDIFGLRLPFSSSYRFRSALAFHYRLLYEEIRREIMDGNIMNIDETPVKLRKTTGYVWILAASNKVYYFFRDSREGSFLQDLLADFSGVLVSDFFTAYESLACSHQKCLVHLMRDINDDLRAHPYDGELRCIAEEFGRFLGRAVSSIDRWGLKAYHLRKHVKDADRLLRKVTGKRPRSDCAWKYQKRFDKYRESLFTFLTHDGVPWNNNNAEHAVHYFAKLRRFTDGMFTRGSIEELLTVLSVLQTCEYNSVNPLRFLLSGETSLSRITASGNRQREKVRR